MVTNSIISKYNTLPQLFDDVDPSKKIIFVERLDKIVEKNYADIKSQALAFLHVLQEKKIPTDHKIVLILPRPIDFVPVFWACLYGGYIVAPLSITENEAGKKKIEHICEELENPYIITNKKFFNSIVNKKGAFSTTTINSEKVISVENFTSKEKGLINTSITKDSIAYLQYSSGSTSNPKGVIMKHSNVLYNLDGTISRARITHKDTFLSWLPLSHDMGLLGTHLLPMASSCNQYLAEPKLFIRYPLFWIQKAAKVKATVLFSPNFGFNYFLQNFDSKKHFIDNLSNVRLIFNGAEPINVDLCLRFVKTLKKYGLDDNAIYAGYGMAEAGLVISIPEPKSKITYLDLDRNQIKIGSILPKTKDKNSGKFISLGKVINHQQLRICDEADEVLPDSFVGKIQIKGKNVTSGYYNNLKATKQTITNDGWLRTGDIGSISNNEMYILGRDKEMIIINGQNYFPHDIEQIIEQNNPELKGNIIVASHSFEEIEKIIIFIKSKKKFWTKSLENQLKETLFKTYGFGATEIVLVNSIPKTTSGKIQRHVLIANYFKEKEADNYNKPNNYTNTNIFKSVLESCFGKSDFDFDKSLMDQGCSSMQISILAEKLNEKFDKNISALDLFEYNTPNEFLQYINISKNNNKAIQKKQNVSSSFEPIAIVGSSCVFPGNVNNSDELWKLLINAEDTVSTIPSNRWPKDNYYTAGSQKKGKMYTDKGHFVNDIDKFDSLFFGVSSDEASSLDPQQRLLLKTVWKTIEDAGITKKELSGSDTGVFIGMSNVDYDQAHIRSGNSNLINQYSLTSVLRSTAAGRISYFYNLNGPALTTDTACSSSLVSLHLACKAIQNGECTQAFAGGVNLILSPEGSIALSQVKALSEDAQCKSFDEKADGYGRAEGIGIVFIKKLDQAIKDNNTILGVIRGSAINQDGRSNGLTAPNGIAQKKLIEKALLSGNIDANEVSYVEAHGTGTPLGDPLELQAINKVYNIDREKGNQLLIGSIKSNIGHAESAAGIAGFLKILQAFKNNKIPPNLHFKNPNSLIPWNELNLKIVDTPIDWNNTKKKRLAGISSFGFSGTNAHLIVESPPEKEENNKAIEKPYHQICISSHRKDALSKEKQQLKIFIEENNPKPIDIAHTWNVKREKFEFKQAFGFKDLKELSSLLDDENLTPKFKQKDRKKLAVVFSGQGSQYSGVCLELFKHSPLFKSTILKCEAHLSDKLPIKLTALLFDEKHAELLNQTQYTQVAICSISFSLYKLLSSYGIKPNVVCGHSIGEYVAACVAGVFSLKDMLHIVAERGRLMQSLPKDSGMISVMSTLEIAQKIVLENNIDLDVAVINNENQIVFGGKKTEIEKASKIFDAHDLFNIPLKVSHAFHSKAMNPILEEFQQFIETCKLSDSKIPIYRNKNGLQAKNDSLKDSNTWANHIRETVNYDACVSEMLKDGVTDFIELGPSNTLVRITKLNTNFKGEAFSATKKGTSSFNTFQNLLGNLFSLGYNVNWDYETAIYGGNLTKLPNRVWIEKSYWLQPVLPDQNNLPEKEENNSLESLYYLDYKNETKTDTVDSNNYYYYPTENNVLKNLLTVFSAKPLQTDGVFADNTTIFIQIPTSKKVNPDDFTTTLKEYLGIVNSLAAQKSKVNITLINSKIEDENTSSNYLDLPINAMFRNLANECDYITLNNVDSIFETKQNSIQTVKKKLPIWKKTKERANSTSSSKEANVCVITGGFGAIGKILCEHLLSNNVIEIYIPIRNKLNEERQLWLKNTNNRFSGKISTIKCDISSSSDVEDFFSIIKKHHSEINQIYHLAGYLNDELCGEVTLNHFENTIKPKLYGSFWLHKHSISLKPKAFILFSSASAYFTNAGQVSYAVANSCLNSVLKLRQEMNLPVKLIAWGPWLGEGMAKSLIEGFEDLGIKPFSAKKGMQLLEQAILHKHNELLALDSIEKKSNANFINNCYASIEGLVLEKQEQIINLDIANMSSDDAMTYLVKNTNSIAKEVLKFDENAPLSNSKSYFEIGFNSLSLNQFRNRLNKFLGSEVVAVSILFKHVSINKLCKFIIEKNEEINQNEKENNDINYSQSNSNLQLLEEIKSMSDDKIEQLINKHYN